MQGRSMLRPYSIYVANNLTLDTFLNIPKYVNICKVLGITEEIS